MTPQDTPRQTKAERRDAAREQARRMREEQARRERRNRVLLIGGLVVVVALIAVAVVAIIGNSGTKSLDDVAAPAPATAEGGIPVAADGVGATNDGVPTVTIYSDYMCPICGEFESINGTTLDELAASGEATIVYHPIAILDGFSQGTQYSTRSTQAVAVVADQAPDQFLAFHQALFANQPEENTPGLSDDEIAQVALDAGVPQDVVDAFGDGTFTPWVSAVTTQAESDLVAAGMDRPGTPAILIDGELWGANWTDPAALPDAVAAASGAAPTEDAATTPAG